MTSRSGRIGRGIGGDLGRRFWTLFSASLLANFSDGIFQIALPLLAVSLTTEPGLVAGVAVASRLPWLVFALIAGALADRLDRRRTMILVDAGRVVLIGGLVVAVVAGSRRSGCSTSSRSCSAASRRCSTRRRARCSPMSSARTGSSPRTAG